MNFGIVLSILLIIFVLMNSEIISVGIVMCSVCIFSVEICSRLMV